MSRISDRITQPPLLVGLLLITAMSAMPAAAQDCETKIGALGPMSGGAAAWGIAMKAGADFVAAAVNETGGLQIGNRKCKVTVLTYDTKYTADGAAAGANFLASQNVKVIIGPVGSPEATGIKPVANRNQQLTFNSSYAKDAIGTQFPLAFHQLAGPVVWAPPLVKAAKERFKITSVVVVAPNDQGGTDVASVNADTYKANGIKTTEEYYQRGTTNFAPIVTRIMNVRPDAVDTASSPPGDAATMVKQLLEAGFSGVIGRLGGPGTPEIIRAAGGVEKIKGFYWLELVAIDDPKVKAMLTEYQRVMKTAAPDNTPMFTGGGNADGAEGGPRERIAMPKRSPPRCASSRPRTRIWARACVGSVELRRQPGTGLPGRHGPGRRRQHLA
jgi:branched-chain amino acid transport system substrate-binding protein